jgi:transposase
VSQRSTVAETIRQGLKRWRGLIRFLDDGHIEMDTTSVERANRLIAMAKRTVCSRAMMRGHLIGPVSPRWLRQQKLNRLNPQAYLANVLTNGWRMKKLEELLPWARSEQSIGDKRAA